MTIKVNLKIFLFVILFYITRQIELYAILMIFALIHEIGHLVSGILLGFKPKALKIMPLGVTVEFSVITKDYNKKIKNANLLVIKKMIIVLAGPLTNLVMIFIMGFFKKYINIDTYSKIIYANILIAVFNLLPVYPLDGGRFVKLLIHIIKGNKTSIKCTNAISNIFMIILTVAASIGIYYYKNLAIIFIIVYLWGITMIENKKYKIKNRIYKMIENS